MSILQICYSNWLKMDILLLKGTVLPSAMPMATPSTIVSGKR